MPPSFVAEESPLCLLHSFGLVRFECGSPCSHGSWRGWSRYLVFIAMGALQRLVQRAEAWLHRWIVRVKQLETQYHTWWVYTKHWTPNRVGFTRPFSQRVRQRTASRLLEFHNLAEALDQFNIYDQQKIAQVAGLLVSELDICVRERLKGVALPSRRSRSSTWSCSRGPASKRASRQGRCGKEICAKERETSDPRCAVWPCPTVSRSWS